MLNIKERLNHFFQINPIFFRWGLTLVTALSLSACATEMGDANPNISGNSNPKIEEAYCQIKTGLLAVLPDHPTEGEIGFQILVQPNKPPWELEPVTVYIENVASEKLKALKNLNLDELHLRSRFSGVENFHIVCEYYNENGKSYLTAIQLKEGENWLDELWSK